MTRSMLRLPTTATRATQSPQRQSVPAQALRPRGDAVGPVLLRDQFQGNGCELRDQLLSDQLQRRFHRQPTHLLGLLGDRRGHAPVLHCRQGIRVASNPTTKICCCRLAAWIAFTAPSAISSFWANTASIFFCACRMFSMTVNPLARSKSAV